jgi:hypothetical protein
MNLKIRAADDISSRQAHDLIIDGVNGYSFKGAPYGTAS